MIRLRFHGWVGSGQVVSPASRANSEGRKSMLTDAHQSKFGNIALQNALAQAHSRFTTSSAHQTTSLSLSLLNSRDKKRDVFLSFRGEDTRNNFTSHLSSAFSRQNIETFIDDQLIRGDEISESLLDAIEASTISIIIFSERYASSRWCLDELLKILECKHDYGQIVIPVFYGVDPSHVRWQTGIFGNLFSKLEERFPEMRKRWRNALTEAANLSGFNSHVIRPESKLIEEISDEVLKRLDDTFENDNKELVGVECPINEIESLLRTGSAGVCKLGIWGIGGIGKTTIAGAVFNKTSRHFEGSYFAHNVREAQENGGLAHLRQQLLSTLLNDRNVKNFPNIVLNFQSKRFTRKKVLIVFDDVTHLQQIEFLIGRIDWLASGSRIIITTRDKHVLSNCLVDQIYEVKELVDVYALKLFSRRAFGEDDPNASYTELTQVAVKYAKGVPLALKVLGSFLFGRRKEEWKSAMKKMEIVPHMEIQEVLKISYDGLDDHEQDIFLDIACFLVGEDRDQVMRFLNSCGFFAEVGLSVLVDKSLITIDYNTIRMHDLLRDMGREIVRKESIHHPGERSRLWHYKDIYEVLTRNMGTTAIQAISLDMSKVNNEIRINRSTFSKMPKLRFLKFYGKNKCMLSHFKGVPFTDVRYFEWHEFPLKTLNIRAENLVSLKLPGSNVEQLWDDVQNLVNIKEIDLHGSKQLSKLPDLSQARNLERLKLDGCSSLMETHSSIQYLNKLEVLDLRLCENLRSLPDTICSESLFELRLWGCSNLKNFPEISSSHIHFLDLYECGIEDMPLSIECLSKLNSLDIHNCTRLEYIKSSIFKLKSLKHIEISSCSNLKRFPEISSSCNREGSTGIEKLPLSELYQLELKNSSRLESLPSSLSILKSLQIRGCPKLEILPDELGNLKALEELRVEETAIRGIPESLGQLSSLAFLYLNYNNLERIPESLGQLSSLEVLHLKGNNLERIPESIRHLSKLKSLDISYCEWLHTLPELPRNLYHLEAHHCTLLEALSGFSLVSFSSFVDLSNCYKLDPKKLGEIVKDSLQKDHERRRKQTHNNKWIHRRMYFPGNEIPKWFRYQSMGSSATLEMPPTGFFSNKKLMGFAVCAIVAFRDQHHDSDSRYSGHYEYDRKDNLYSLDCTWKVKSEGCYRDLRSWYFGTISSYVRLQWKSQTVHDESELHGEHIVQSIEGTRALALQLRHKLGSGWKIFASFKGNFSEQDQTAPFGQTFWYEKYQDSKRVCDVPPLTPIPPSCRMSNVSNTNSNFGSLIKVRFAANAKLGLGRAIIIKPHELWYEFFQAHRLSAHGSPAHGLSAHGLSAHGLSAHGLSAHGLSAHGSSAHGLSAHRLSAHGLSAHGLSAHRTSANRKSAHGAN
ncbi:ADP-ribosyl cyclase/cyclic ADP-ribose hydrolase [Citrus sinensis]|uniref:ADP-ribosyl cyclase/cyclic ADP-ribose hydrolase n=1 Tax=Citrus sinensis TaxID=2711 RepID=A0ACB8MAK0_CITSI|nr:ADP-ribosyl cyclase/cyclic ADP-ribose hydrolase [Citrus sinensis]